MFPIEAVGSKTVGFGGRVLGEGEPKYLNSPETALFRKRKTLYGVPQALEALRETREAILVEGYTDVLALANVGVRGAIAALEDGIHRGPRGVANAQLRQSGDRALRRRRGGQPRRRGELRPAARRGPLGAWRVCRRARPDSFVRNRGAGLRCARCWTRRRP